MKLAGEIARIIEDATRQAAHHQHERGDGTVIAVSKPAASAGSLSLRSLEVGSDIGPGRGLRDEVSPSNSLIPISAYIANQSRIAAAGAHLIVHEDAPEARVFGSADNAGMAFVTRPRKFVAIDAAPFVLVPDGSEVSATDERVYRSQIEWNGPSYAVRHELTRERLRVFGLEHVSAELAESIAMGLARAADHSLLSAIAALTPSAFSIAAAATAGLDWSDLRAIIGTDATGAHISEDGTLRAAGIVAALTNTTPGTLAGSFRHAAVSVQDNIRVSVAREINGSLTFTCWADFDAMLPRADVFWSVTA